MRRLAVLPGAFVEWFAGALFGVTLALLTLALGLLPPAAVPVLVATLGAPVALAAVVVTTQRFNDSYTGTKAWPDALAIVFGVAVAAAELALTRRAWPRSPRASA